MAGQWEEKIIGIIIFISNSTDSSRITFELILVDWNCDLIMTSPAHSKALAIAPKFTAFLSICGSLGIVLKVLSNESRRNKTMHRIVMGMSICDILASIWYFTMENLANLSCISHSPWVWTKFGPWRAHLVTLRFCSVSGQVTIQFLPDHNWSRSQVTPQSRCELRTKITVGFYCRPPILTQSD